MEKEFKDTYATTWEYGVIQDGHKECDHCNGYGSSLKDDWNVNTCTVCGGSGLVKLPPPTGDE